MPCLMRNVAVHHAKNVMVSGSYAQDVKHLIVSPLDVEQAGELLQTIIPPEICVSYIHDLQYKRRLCQASALGTLLVETAL